ncbi:MAG: hypothetical protein A3H64_02685 [Candidatus Ryanbacteria bacterium RIFCSPLOWO2_02_FULL_45_11c]|uniref:Phosphoribosyltransferase domain-containing protein n=1 Tax=Candidatus Ryanbacteria bacterium RIFCSPLOWO2_02_FULL_45_11c TaxID=1802128 RepID=A0A1G2H2R0_9BACT|nr:MAG: hypothetical protein A3H64_02685 [Candidatus Ryanbacteria bacterium RIFCSPLOWO2_02_FULL_45_11c]
MSEKLNLLDVCPEFFTTGVFNPAAAILTWLKNEDAYWEYQGESSSERPHAELSGGGCSNGFIDMPAILKYPYICEILGKELGKRLKMSGVEADWVISSPYSAITLGHEVAKELGAIFGHPIKDPTDPKQKRMLWRGRLLPKGSRVLQVEELITTTSTIVEVRNAVEEVHKGKYLQWFAMVGTAVHRPALLPVVFAIPRIVALLEKEMQNYIKDKITGTTNCPYCEVGSEKLRPRDNWAELTGT